MTDHDDPSAASSPGHDPFEALRRPDAPIAPSATFARRLRQQLSTALQPLLAASAGSTTTAAGTRQLPRKATTMTITPYLSVRNAIAALDFYRDAFGAVETQRMVGDDGRVGHAEMTVGDSTLMLADEYPEIDSVGPQTRGGPTCMFNLDVGSADEVDETYRRALSLGAESVREPADQFHGNRSATVSDPFGHRWTLTAQIEQLTTDEYAARASAGSFELQVPAAQHDGGAPDGQTKHHEQGDLYYFTLPVADVAAAQRFFGAVLGWQFSTPDQGHVENIAAPPGSVSPTGDVGARLWFVVDDIHTAIDRVRAAGGTAQDPVHYESGWSSDCTDDQGTVFSLSVPSDEYSI